MTIDEEIKRLLQRSGELFAKEQCHACMNTPDYCEYCNDDSSQYIPCYMDEEVNMFN